jgi:hypothetical protein
VHENHQLEQYFFAPPTLDGLADLVAPFRDPLLLCCPMLGRHLQSRGRAVRTLDLDERFATLPGFVRWDVHRPEPLPGTDVPDLVVVDPPFTRVRLDQLFLALRVLTRGDDTVPLLVAWPVDRASALLGTFAASGLRPTGIRPVYVSVSDAIGIELYSNLDEAALAPLRAAGPTAT